MVSKRDCFIDFTNYLESLGINVNISKNKARGYHGLFIAKKGEPFRIDISKDVNESNVIPILLHEFAHYIHYRYDSSLSSLDFIFKDINDDEMEELLRVTVEKIPQNTAQSLYNKKNEVSDSIQQLAEIIRLEYPDFRLSKPYKQIEQTLKSPVRYLLKADRVKYLNKIYSIENLNEDFKSLTKCQAAYILLKSKQRFMSRINSRINKLNKYYNTPTELWARFCEMFFTDINKTKKLAPVLSLRFIDILNTNKIKELSDVNKILQNIL